MGIARIDSTPTLGQTMFKRHIQTPFTVSKIIYYPLFAIILLSTGCNYFVTPCFQLFCYPLLAIFCYPLLADPNKLMSPCCLPITRSCQVFLNNMISLLFSKTNNNPGAKNSYTDDNDEAPPLGCRLPCLWN